MALLTFYYVPAVIVVVTTPPVTPPPNLVPPDSVVTLPAPVTPDLGTSGGNSPPNIAAIAAHHAFMHRRHPGHRRR